MPLDISLIFGINTCHVNTLYSKKFLDAFSHLYKRVCPSVGRSVRPSVRPSVGRSVTHELKSRIWPVLSKVMVQDGM